MRGRGFEEGGEGQNQCAGGFNLFLPWQAAGRGQKEIKKTPTTNSANQFEGEENEGGGEEEKIAFVFGNKAREAQRLSAVSQHG